MNSYTTYSERITTIPPVVCGYALRPFSLGHSILLKSAGSKFVSGEYNNFLYVGNIARLLHSEALEKKNDLLKEFIYALLVCSTSFDDFEEEVNNRTIYQSLESMNKILTSKKWKWNVTIDNIKRNVTIDNIERLFRTYKYDLVMEIHKFAHYLKDGTNAPAYQQKFNSNGNNKQSGIDFEWAIIDALLSEKKYDIHDALNRAFNETLSAYILLLCKNSDKIDLLSQSDCDFINEANKGKK